MSVGAIGSGYQAAVMDWKKGWPCWEKEVEKKVKKSWIFFKFNKIEIAKI
jgi:hypothetical protein